MGRADGRPMQIVFSFEIFFCLWVNSTTTKTIFNETMLIAAAMKTENRHYEH